MLAMRGLSLALVCIAGWGHARRLQLTGYKEPMLGTSDSTELVVAPQSSKALARLLEVFSPAAAFTALSRAPLPCSRLQRTRGVSMTEPLKPGDTVTVIGASGNVGKLVALRLSKQFKVRGVVRSASKVRPFLEDKVELFEADLNDPADVLDEKLQAALSGAHAVVICTGTTAFPTKAWSPTGDTEVTGSVLSAWLGSGLNVREAVAKLDAEGLNTPKNVDEDGTRAILKNWATAAGTNRKRFIMMSSIGVQRRDQMPFPILNTCGVLDAKAAAEAAVKADAEAGSYSYTVVRPGQLFGGPYDNNFYLGTLFELDKAKPQDVQMASGDTLVGDTLRSTLAEVIASLLENEAALDTDFSVVNIDGTPPSIDELQKRLATL